MFYICINVINAAVSAKKKLNVICRCKNLNRLTLQRMTPHSERGFAFIGRLVAGNVTPGMKLLTSKITLLNLFRYERIVLL